MKAEREIISESKAADETETEFEWPEPQSEMAKALLPALKALDASGTPKLSFEEIEEYLGRKLGGIAEAFPDGSILSAKAATLGLGNNGIPPAGAATPSIPNPHGPTLMALAKAIDEAGVPKLTIEEIEAYLGRPLGGIAAAYPDGKR